MQAGDICVLDRIATLMADVSSSSDAGDKQVAEGTAGRNSDDSEGTRKAGRDKDAHDLEGARICAALSQMTVVLEQKGPGQFMDIPRTVLTILPDLIKRTRETMTLIKRHDYFLELLVLPGDADERSQRLGGKVERALERVRRAAIALVDSSTAKTPENGQETVQALLEVLLDVFDTSLRQVGPSPSYFPL